MNVVDDYDDMSFMEYLVGMMEACLFWEIEPSRKHALNAHAVFLTSLIR